MKWTNIGVSMHHQNNKKITIRTIIKMGKETARKYKMENKQIKMNRMNRKRKELGTDGKTR